MDKEHRVSVYDMVKELNLKEVTPEINSKEVYIEQAEINRPCLIQDHNFLYSNMILYIILILI